MKKTSSSNWFNRSLVILAWLIVIGGAIGLIKYLFFTNKFVSTNDAQVEQYITPVASKVAGFVKEVRFQENQAIKKGDTLIIIDNREYINDLSMAQADLQSTQGSASVNQKAVSVSKGAIAVHKARLDAAKVEVWRTKKDYLRFDKLVKEEAATGQQFEQAKAAYELALAHLKTIKEEQSSAELSSVQETAKLAPVNAAVQQKRAALQNASLYLSFTVVTAPYDGWVGKLTIQPGQLVKEGQTLVNVVSLEKWVSANFRETQIAPLRVGNKVIIKADAFPGEEFSGVIESFSPASGSKFSLVPQDNSTGNFVKIEQRIPMRIKFDNHPELDRLRAGMNVIINAEKTTSRR